MRAGRRKVVLVGEFSEREGKDPTRREVLHGAAALTTVCLLGCEAQAEQIHTPFSQALADPHVVHGEVTFRSGATTIDGYLSRPEARGRYPAVLVITGNKVSEDYIRATTALLAEAGFVGLAPNIFSLQLDTMTAEEKREVFVTKITDDLIFQDLQAGVDYLKSQPFVRRGRMGITGFCFGGRCALMFGAKSKDIGAVVPFYGNLKTPPFANRAMDPIDLVQQMAVPIQGHYSKNDPEIPLAQLGKFEHDIRARGVEAELFTYDAAHGFFAYTRSSYNAEAAQLAWRRAITFLRRVLK